MIRRKATVLLAGALLLTGACTTYQIPYDPGTTIAPTPVAPVATSATVTTTTVLATSATAIAPAPVTTIRPAGPPATAGPATVASPPPSVAPRRFTGASSVVAALVLPAVVDIEGVLGVQHSFGTGMVLTPSGQVLTNNHVIRGARTITATVVGTGRIFTARVVGVDANADVALLQLQNPVGLAGITVAGTPVIPGDLVAAIGNAGGRGGGPTVMTGSVIATGQALVAADANGGVEHLSNLIEISASPQPGDSGGPLANGAGEIIGMVVASSDGAGYAIPISTVISVAQRIQPASG